MVFIEVFSISLAVSDLDHFVDFQTVHVEFIPNNLADRTLYIFLFFEQIFD